MLPASHRLRRSDDFRRAIRSGRRSGRRAVVVHLAFAPVAARPGGGPAAQGEPGADLGSGSVPARKFVPVTPEVEPAAEPARVGFVVNKAVGNAVLRNRVHRRLRAVLAARLTELPAGSMTVVRALPPAATATYQELDADVAAALDRLLSRGPGPEDRTGRSRPAVDRRPTVRRTEVRSEHSGRSGGDGRGGGAR